MASACFLLCSFPLDRDHAAIARVRGGGDILHNAVGQRILVVEVHVTRKYSYDGRIFVLGYGMIEPLYVGTPGAHARISAHAQVLTPNLGAVCNQGILV